MNSQYQESFLTPKSFSLPLHCTPIAIQAASSATNESYSLALDSEMHSLTNVLKISKENTIQCETAQNSAARDCSKNIQLIDFEEFQRSEEASGCHHYLLGINESDVSLNQQESSSNKEFLKDFERDFQISKVRISSITPTNGQLKNPSKDNVIVEENDSECSRSSDRILLLNKQNFKQESSQIPRQDSKEFKKIQNYNSNQRLTTNSCQQNESASNRQNSQRIKENLQTENSSHRNTEKECEDSSSPSASLKMVRHEFKNLINNYKQRTSVSLSHENGFLHQHQQQQQQEKQQQQELSSIQVPKQLVTMIQNKTEESKISASQKKGEFFLIKRLHTSDAELSRYLSCEESQALVLEATGEQFLFHSSEMDKGEKLERLQISNEFLPTGSSGFSSNLLAETIYSGQDSNRMYVINSADKSKRKATTVTGRNERLDFAESAEKNNLKKEIIKLLGELQDAEKEIKRCNEIVRQQSRDIAVLEQNMEYFKAELEVKDEEISAKQQIADNKDQQISTLFKEREGLKMKKRVLKDTVESLRQEIEEVRQKQTDDVKYQADREILELRQELADKERYIEGQMDYFRKQQGIKTDQINGLQREIEALQRHNVHLQRLNQSLASEIKFGEKVTHERVNTSNHQDAYGQYNQLNKQAMMQQEAFQFNTDSNNDSAISSMNRNNYPYKNQSGIERNSAGNVAKVSSNNLSSNANSSSMQNALGRPTSNNPSRLRSFSHNDSTSQQGGPSISIIDSYQPGPSVSQNYLPISKSSSNSTIAQYQKSTIITEPSLNQSSIDMLTAEFPKNSPLTQQNNIQSHQRASSCSSNQLRHSYDSYKNIQRFQEPQQLQSQLIQSNQQQQQQQHEKQQKQLQQLQNSKFPQNTQKNEQVYCSAYNQQAPKQQQQQQGSERETTLSSNLSPFPSKGSNPAGWDSAIAPKSSASTSCNSKHLDNSHYQAHESITSRFSSNSSSQRQQQLQQHGLISPLQPCDPQNTSMQGMHLNPSCNIPKPITKRNRAESSYESTSNNSRNSSGAANHNFSYNEENSRQLNSYVSQGNQKDNYKSRELEGRYVRAWSVDVPQPIVQKTQASDIQQSNDFLSKEFQFQPKYQQQQYYQIEQVPLQNKIALNSSEIAGAIDPPMRQSLATNKNTNNTSSSQFLSKKSISTQPEMQQYYRKNNEFNSMQQNQIVVPNIKPFHTESSDNLSYPQNPQMMYQQPMGGNKAAERKPPRNQQQDNNFQSVVSGNYTNEDTQQRQLLPYKQVETNYNRKRNGDASTASYGSFKS